MGDADRAARLQLGLAQVEVAKKVGLKSSVYGRVERGMMTPSVPTLRRMCETLGILGRAPVPGSPGPRGDNTSPSAQGRRAPGS
ncbi:multiprotein-bridging factor 1 family protein [Cystobacter fuscus]|uniref:multiprotein-bridging factor 1 family protein n=1 Tax=Cystobacter fuscus TaxID=43 RepID=UPI0037C0B314